MEPRPHLKKEKKFEEETWNQYFYLALKTTIQVTTETFCKS